MIEKDRQHVQRLARRLPESQGRSVRRAVQALLDGVPVCVPDIVACTEVVSAPAASRWCEYVLACRVLSETAPDPRLRSLAEEPLCEIGDGNCPNDWSDGSADVCALWTGLAALAIGIVTGIYVFGSLAAEVSINENPFDRAIEVPLTALLTSLLTAVVSYAGMLAVSLPLVAPIMARSRRANAECGRKWAVRTLGQWRSVPALGTLARCSQALDPTLKNESREALRSVLPTVAASDYGRVTARDQASLAELLLSDLGSETKSNVLRALGHAGGGAILGIVSRAATGALGEQIAGEARAILPQVEQRARMERDSSRLLRPSKNLQAAAQLVRPLARPEADPALLVRPADV